MKYCITLLILLATLDCFPQRKTFTINTPQNLLYYVDESQTALMPIIEEQLYNLQFTGTQTPCFKEIRSLNNFKAGKDIRAALFNTYSYYDQKKGNLKIESTLPIDDSIAKTFGSNGLLLSIHINTINNYLEYQLKLFKFKVTSENTRRFVSPDFNVYRSTSVIVDPSRSTYKQDLLRGLKEIITEANDKPSPLLQSPSHRIIRDSINLLVNDTLKLQASVVDDDSPDDKIKYEWSLKTVSGDSNYNYVVNEIKQKSIVFYGPGTFELTLKATDGISEYIEKKYLIQTFKKPSINDLYYVGFPVYLFHDDYYSSISYGFGKADIYSYTLIRSDYNTIIGKRSDAKLKFRIPGQKLDNITFTVSEPDHVYARRPEESNPSFTVPVNSDSIPDRVKFTVYLDKADSTMEILTPQSLNIPCKYVIHMTPYENGLSGQSKDLLLQFRMIRKLFFMYAYEYSFRKSNDFALKAGLGYTFFLYTYKANLRLNQGFYLVRSDIQKDVSLNNFQEVYLEIPYPESPFSLKMGVKNFMYKVTNDMKNQLSILAGFDFIISSRLLKQHLYLNWAFNPFPDAYIKHQFSLGTSLDIFTSRGK